VLAVGAALLGTATAPAQATSPVTVAPPATGSPAPATKPVKKPAKPTLPVPRATVDPALAVGGERLASMGVVADLPAGVPAPPRLRDVSWVLADLDTGEVIAAKAPHARLLPASTLKALTALTLIPKVTPNRVVRATAAHAAADGTRVGMVPGLTYTGRQLFQALLMSSANDAAYALADAGGGRQATLAAMNEQAAHLGAHDTVAKDPSGLDVRGQTSSAYDLALIGRAALELDDFRRYVTTKQADFPALPNPKTKKRASFKINNHNRLLYNYPGTIGVKNGYTRAAHRTFISAVSRGGRTYLLTEMYGLDGSWRPQAAMYDWAFRYGQRARPVGRLVDPGEVPARPTPAPTSPAPATAPSPTPLAPTEAPRTRTAAAAAVPSSQLATAGVQPWVGVAGLGALASLLGLFVVRTRRQRRLARH